MKCKKCKNTIENNSTVCKYCNTTVAKKANKVLISILCVLLVMVIALGSFALWHFLGKKDDAEVVKQPTIEAENTSETGGESGQSNQAAALSLYVEDDNVNINTESTVVFRVISDKEIDNNLEIVDADTSKVITYLSVANTNDDGSVEYSGTYTFTPDTTDDINVYARAGKDISNESHISVRNPVSDEGREEFRELMDDFADYMSSVELEDVLPEDELKMVEKWLNDQPAVAEVEIRGESVYYLTNGGVGSCHTVEETNPFCASSEKDDFKEDTTAVEYYQKWKKDSGSLRETDGDISYLPADITITNDNTAILIPTKDANDGFQRTWFETLRDIIQNSPKLGGVVDFLETPNEVMDAISNHSLVNYGTIYLAAHGGNDGNYYFKIFESTNKSSWEEFEEDYGHLVQKLDLFEELFGAEWDIQYNTGTNSDGELVYKILLSSRYIVDCYDEYNFDNTVIVLFSCYGLSDETFNNFLTSRNVQCVMGSRDSIWFLAMNQFAKDVLVPFYCNSGNEASKLNSIWDSAVEPDSSFVRTYDSYSDSSGQILPFNVYWDKYKENISFFDREKKRLIKDATVDDNIVDTDRIAQYYAWRYELDVENVKVTFYEEASTNTQGLARAANTFDVELRNLPQTYEIRPNNFDDFILEGNGKISGTLYEGRTERTVHADGSHTDVQKKGEILKNTDISANRFLNQGFREEDIATSSSNGRFTFEGENGEVFPWGHYVITSKDPDYEGEASIILTQDSTDGGELILNGGKSYISGFAMGKKELKGNATVALGGATITLHNSSGAEIDCVDAKDSGFFEFKDLEDDVYTLTISHEDYETLECSFTVKKGYEYKCEQGVFVLELDESAKDIVLVVDVSGSMDGSPMSSMKTACKRFANNILGKNNGCRVAMVTYDDYASAVVPFTKYRSKIETAANGLYAGGGTNIESGLMRAEELLTDSQKKKTIVLMSDGQPNGGKEGNELIDYASTIKNKDITIYTLGFFDALGSDAAECRSLMNSLASYGYHYEASSEADLINFFSDISEQVNNKKVTHITVACPVDVYATYNGETLSSAEDSLCTRTSFGSLMFDGDEDDPIKVLRFDESLDVDIRIEGYGEGTMDYTVSYVDADGNYTDVREFKDIAVTDKLIATAKPKRSDVTTLNLDNDGDGKVDEVLEVAGKGAKTETEGSKKEDKKENSNNLLLIIIIGAGSLILLAAVIILVKKRKKKAVKTADESKTELPVKDTIAPVVTAIPTTSAPAEAVTKALSVDKTPAAESTPKKIFIGRFCENCGTALNDTDEFCSNCGTSRIVK